MEHSHRTLQNECFVRDVLQKLHVKSSTSKIHSSSLQNERFARDLLKNSHLESAKQALRTTLPPNVTCQVSKTSISYETTHQAALPSSFAIPAPPNNARSHANPNVTATFTSTTTRNLTIPCACHKNLRVHTSNTHKILRLLRKSHLHTSKMHKVHQSTAPATKSDNIISRQLQHDLHHTTRLE